jgi:alpha-1,3-rhamnosyl/mannosyltransferase
MRIIFNRFATLGARTGIGHHAAELLAALTVAQDGADDIAAYPAGWTWSALSRLMGSPAKANSAGRAPRPVPAILKSSGGVLSKAARSSAVRGGLKAALLPIRAFHFKALCGGEKYDLYHEPDFNPMPFDGPTIPTLHDLSAIVHPEWHPSDRVRQHERTLDRALSQCAHLFTGSEFTRQEIIRELGVNPARVTRIYHGIRENLFPLSADEVAAGLRRLGLPPTYLLHVGTLEPRKNLDMLLRAYCRLPDFIRQRSPLLLVGKWGWKTAALADYIATEARHRGVIHLGYLAEEHLNLLYNGARALVYPSLYEGFGLPPVEMLACGGAVLASTAGSVAEVVGPHGYLIDALDSDGWNAAMQRVILDDDWRRELCLGGRRWAGRFTWERAASDVLATYRIVLGERTSLPLAA